MPNIDYAMAYHRAGLSIIPCKKDKKPLLTSWKVYQERVPTEEEVRGWWEKWPNANIGLITGKISGITVLDLDGPEGINTASIEIPSEYFDTPTVHTPGGGMHLWYKYKEGMGNATRILPGIDIRGDGGYVIVPPSMNEVGAYYTWDSQYNLKTATLGEIPAINVPKKGSLSPPKEESNIRDSSLSPPSPASAYYSTEKPKSQDLYSRHICLEEGTRDESLFTIANALIRARIDEKEVKEVLNIISRSCTPPFPTTEAERKISSAIERASRRERPIAEEVREFVLSSNGVILSSEVVKSLQVSSKEDVKNVSKVLARFVDEGLIERFGKRNGQFRIIDTNYDEIDIIGADTTPMNIKWPFDIEKLFLTMPKNVIIVAGEPDSGKTAFMMNFAKLNMYDQEVQYLSSEMGAQELKSRLIKFDCPLDDWKKVKWIERSSDFADLIKPNAVNIIDFMEIHDQFWIIGGWIKEIFDKLENGIAVIALQKGIGKEVGRGGDITLEKPRLYLNMFPGVIKIRKCKNWANPIINPNKKLKTFKLVDGCRFISGWDWQVEEEKEKP